MCAKITFDHSYPYREGVIIAMPDKAPHMTIATSLIDLRPLSRRQTIRLLGVSTAASFVASLGEPWVAAEPSQTNTMPTCVMRPQQTEGPYFVDEKLNRSDIRRDPSDGSVQAGVELHLRFRVSRVAGRTCTPLTGAVVDLWHCDAQGVYSDVRDWSFDTRGQKFLRGYQVTDANGVAEFITIYPGWYPGRTVHMHFKIRTDMPSRPGYAFTSQLYFDDALTDHVYQQAPYATKTAGRRTRNNRDGNFRHGGERLILALSPNAQGYASTFDIGLQTS